MSYDVHFLEGPCSCESDCTCKDVVDSLNYTSNMHLAWERAGIMIRKWGGRLAADVYVELQQGIRRITMTPAHYIQYEPANGWGSVRSMLIWLRELEAVCLENPTAVLRVSF